MRTIALSICFLLACAAQDAPPPLDGPRQIFHDDVLDRMAGRWNLAGVIRGRKVQHSVEARWVLNHQFLQIHERDTADPSSYEAIIMAGYDQVSERYVAHWNDVYGGRFSETLGYGSRSGNEIAFLFEYPDGPFRTVFRWLPDRKEWEWHMRSKNANGQWEDFGRMTLTALPG